MLPRTHDVWQASIGLGFQSTWLGFHATWLGFHSTWRGFHSTRLGVKRVLAGANGRDALDPDRASKLCTDASHPNPLPQLVLQTSLVQPSRDVLDATKIYDCKDSYASKRDDERVSNKLSQNSDADEQITANRWIAEHTCTKMFG